MFLDTMFAVKMLNVIVTVLACLSAVVAGALGSVMFPFAVSAIVVVTSIHILYRRSNNILNSRLPALHQSSHDGAGRPWNDKFS